MRNGSRTLNRCALETCFSMEFPCLLVLYKAYQLRKMKMYYLLPGQNFHKCRTKSIAYPSLPILGTLDGSVLLWALPLWEFSPFFTACCLIAKSCLTLFDLMDHSPSGSSVHGISQARILKWVAISFSRGSSQPRDQIQVSCIANSSPSEPPGKSFPLETLTTQKLKDLLLLGWLNCWLQLFLIYAVFILF